MIKFICSPLGSNQTVFERTAYRLGIEGRNKGEDAAIGHLVGTGNHIVKLKGDHCFGIIQHFIGLCLRNIALTDFFFQMVGPVIVEFILGGRNFAAVDFFQPVIDRQYASIRIIFPKNGIFIKFSRVFFTGQFFINEAKEEEHFHFCRNIFGIQAVEEGCFIDGIVVIGNICPQTAHFSGFFCLVRSFHKGAYIPAKGIANLPADSGKGQNGGQGVFDLWQAATAGFQRLLPLGIIKFRLLGMIFPGEFIRIVFHLLDKSQSFINFYLYLLCHLGREHDGTHAELNIGRITFLAQ